MLRQTVTYRRRTAALFLILLAGSCRRPDSAEQVYQRLWQLYVSGNLPKTIQAVSAEADRWKGRPNTVWYWKFHLLHAEALLGQSKSKDAAALLEAPVPPLAPLAQLSFRRQIDLANAVLGSDPRQANGLLDEAAAGATDPDLQLRIHLLRGAGRLNDNDIDGAEREFKTVRDQAVAQGNAYREAAALNNLSLCERRRGHFEKGIEFASLALEKAGQAHAGMVQAQAHGNLANYYIYLGNNGGAMEHLPQAHKLFEAIDARADVLTDLNLLGVIADAQGDMAGAIRNYESAWRIAVDLDRKTEAARIAANLSLVFIRDRQWSNAATWNQKASDLAGPAENSQVRPFIVRNEARIADGQERPDDAVRACRTLLEASQKNQILRWEANEILARIDTRSRRFAQANQEFAAALSAIDAARGQLEIPQNRITLLSRLIPFYQEYVDSLVEQDNDAKALTVIESSRARVLAEALRRKAEPMAFDAAGLKRLAETTKSSVISFWMGEKRSFAWLVTPREVRRFTLPAAAEIETSIAAYRNSVEHSWGDPLASKDPAGAKLWEMLLGSMASRIAPGGRVIVIPDGAMHRLNLETLPVPGATPHYWVEDVELTVAPSMTLVAANAKAARAGVPSLLLMGAPLPVANFEKLPQAEAEIAAISGRFPNATKVVFTGAAATAAAYQTAGAAQFSLIHFAAHAEPNPESPQESAIVLSPAQGQFRLKARDIVDSHLTADLVTISACRSAISKVYAGEGLIGLAWAFLEAGSKAVIAGLWDVNDGSSRLLMDQLYAGIAAGQSPSEALHRAKIGLMQSDARFRKPYFWAPFQVYM